jgi:hypothetical protein
LEWADPEAVEELHWNLEVCAMANITYHVALAIVRTEEGDLVVEDAVEVPTSAAAIMQARVIAGGKTGAVAFSRTGDPDLGEYGDAVILARFGETPPEIEPSGASPRTITFGEAG